MKLEYLKYIQISVLILFFFAGGCQKEESAVLQENALSTQKHSYKTKDLAAKVNGVPILLKDVKQLMSEVDGGMSPEEATWALIQNTLLAEEARRLGYDETPEVFDAQRLAMTRAILKKKIGDEVNAQTIDKNKLQKAFDDQKSRFVHGIKRRVVHFIALTGPKGLSDDQAHDIAKQAHAKVRQVKTEEAFESTMKPFLDTHGSKVKVEHIPGFDSDTEKLVKPFVDATFAIPKIGMISKPLNTKYGWHIIFLSEEIPASNKTFGEVKDKLAQELLPSIKKNEAAKLLNQLENSNNIFIYEGSLMEESKKQ